MAESQNSLPSLPSQQRSRHLQELFRVLKLFVRDPISTMRSSVSLSWPSIFILQIGAAMISGGILGILNKSLLDIALGLLILPISTVAISSVFSAFIYYFYSLFHSTFLDFRHLSSIVTLALLPYLLFHVASGYLPPIDLLGFAATALLLIVGLIEQFGLEKRIVVRLILALGCAFLIAWCIAQYRNVGKTVPSEMVPKSLDDLEHDVHK